MSKDILKELKQQIKKTEEARFLMPPITSDLTQLNAKKAGAELKDKYADSKHSKLKIEKLIVHQAKRRLNILVHEVIEREKKHGI